MATIHKLDRKKQADRRTALLGLAADQPATAGVCPTSVEMAELLEDMASPEKKQLLLQHIAVCETCYREWLTLREVLDKRLQNKNRLKMFRLFRPGKALFGTLLAAAASVVVFLNIHHPVNMSPLAPVESIRPTPAPLLQEEEKFRPILQDKGTLPAPEVSALKPDISGKKQEMPVLPDAGKVRKSAPAAPAAMAPISDLKEGLPAQESNAAGAPKALGEAATDGAVRLQTGSRRSMLRQSRLQGGAIFGQWLKELENGCRKGQTSEAFWQEMEFKGREIKARPGDLQPNKQKQLENLLLIIGTEKADVSERCRRINDSLAEGRKGQ